MGQLTKDIIQKSGLRSNVLEKVLDSLPSLRENITNNPGPYVVRPVTPVKAPIQNVFWICLLYKKYEWYFKVCPVWRRKPEIMDAKLVVVGAGGKGKKWNFFWVFHVSDDS